MTTKSPEDRRKERLSVIDPSPPAAGPGFPFASIAARISASLASCSAVILASGTSSSAANAAGPKRAMDSKRTIAPTIGAPPMSFTLVRMMWVSIPRQAGPPHLGAQVHTPCGGNPHEHS